MEEKMIAGKIINTHGLRGELKIENYCDDAEFFSRIKILYIDNSPYTVLSTREHKGCMLAVLDGIDSVESAMALKNKFAHFEKGSVPLPSGTYYITDIYGFDVVDSRVDTCIGTLARVEQLPGSRMYVVKSDLGEIYIPDVPAFVKGIDFDTKRINISTIYGMLPNEN